MIVRPAVRSVGMWKTGCLLVLAMAVGHASLAHNLDQRDTSIVFDQQYLQTMTARAGVGQALVQTNDTFWLILKSTPGPGTLTGVGGYLTYYIPEGVEVQEVGYLTPTPGTPGDQHNPANFTRVALKGQSIIAIGSGPIAPATTTNLIGLALTNAFGQGESLVTAAGVHRGTIAGVYADTGIFYSSDPRTAWQSWSNAPATGTLSRLGYPVAMVNNRGETVVPITRYDAEQLIAYGRADKPPVVDPNGRGSTPWGLGNVVSGPESGYAWEFNLNRWVSSGSNMIAAVTNVGPWKRIKYPGSQYAQDQAGLISSALGYAGQDASDIGYPLGTDPGETPLLPGDANAIRISYGMLELGRPEYAAIKVRIVTAPATECFTMFTDAFGGDAGGEQGGKDHEWRYYDPTTASLSPCTLLTKTASRPLVKPGDTFYYDLVFANNGSVPLPNVSLTDTLPSGISYVSAVPAPSSGPSPLVWNLGTVGSNSMALVRVYVKATSLGTFVNSVVARSGTNFVAQADETVEVSYKALLRGEKTVTPSSVAPGGTVTYTLTVHNDGTGPNGTPLVITEYLPTGFSYVGMVSQEINGAPLAPSFLTVNSSSPSQPKFTVSAAILAGQTLVLKFTCLVSASEPVGEYCNSFSMMYEGKVVSTPPQACVTVGGAQIGDFIWRDWDGDGVQDAGEEGLSNVTVSLYYDANNNGTNDVGETLVGTKTTDATGYYLFTGLQISNYVVAVPVPGSGGVPSGYTLTGDPVAPTNFVADVAITNSTQSMLTMDFGYRPGGAGSIGDQVFEDLNKNGTWDTGEPGISNVTVNLYEDSNGNGVIDSGDVLIASTASATTNGTYSFASLASNLAYIVDVDQADADIGAYFTAKYGAATNMGTSTDPRPVASGFSSVTNADFGFWRDAPATVGDQIFHDVNRDGIYSNTVDLPLANVTVWLYASDGTTLLATTTSSVSGVYSFTGLSPATYVVKVDASDPDIPAYLVASVSQYLGVALTAGQTDDTRDFPFASLLDKAVDKSTATTNETLTFTITPRYAGSAALTNVTVTDVVPAGTTFGSAEQGGANVPPVTWSLGSTLAASNGTTTITGSNVTESTITHVAASSVATNGGNSLSIAMPTGTTSNDVMIAALSWNGGADRTITNVPIGWSLMRSTSTVAGGVSVITQVTGSPTTAWTNTTSLTIAKPTGVKEGDVMIANLQTEHNVTNSPSATGWTLISVATTDAGGKERRMAVLYKVATATDALPGTVAYTFSLGTSVDLANGAIIAFTGVSSSGLGYPSGSGPFDVLPGSINNGGLVAGTTAIAPSITTVTANASVIMLAAMMDGTPGAAFSGWTNTSPGALTELYDYDGAADASIGAAWAIKATAGSTSTGRVTLSASKKWGAIQLALRPADTTAKLGEAAYYKVAGPSESGPYTWGISTNEKWSVGVSTYRGVDTAAPIHTNAAQTNASSVNAIAPSITTSESNTMLVGIFASQNGSPTATPASNMTERIDVSSTSGGTGAAGLELCDAVFVGPGATGAKTGTLTAATVNIGHLIALKPGTTTTPWSYTANSSLSANRSLVTSNDTITVTMTLRATTVSGSPPFPITVTPGALNVTGTSGASATFTTPGSQALGSGVDVVFAYTSTAVTAGSTPGSLTLRATPTDAYGTWAQAAANTVLVTPPLTFTATVNTPPGVNVVTNQARLLTNGMLMALSPVTSTALIGSIGDFVWLDSDADGVQDAGEPGIAGVRVYVDTNGNGQYDAGETNAVTDSSGLYRVYGFAAGTYAVRYDYSTVPSGYLPTTPVIHSATLATGTTQYNDADFGLRAPGAASIGDTVWLDANTNGVRDAGETGLTNITVRLYLDNNTNGAVDGGDFLLQAAATDTNGLYLFSGLATNAYLMQVDGSGLVQSPYDGSVALSNAMSLVSGTDPHAVTLTVTNQAYTNADFGYNWTGTIGDYVWWDANRNQTPDGGEAPVTNAFVMLFYDANSNGILDVLNGDVQIAYTTTDTNGYYYFRGLPPGPYLVDVYEDSIAVGGVVPTTPNSRYINLGAGQTNLTADFGYYMGARVEGNVFWDVNRNAIFETGNETGLTNVTVYLSGTDTNGIPVSLTNQTDASGHFVFVLPEGDYTLTYSSSSLLALYPALQDETTVTNYTLHAYVGENMNPSFDFGVDNTGLIGDTVFGDVNTNGVQDLGEPGLEGVVVVLYDAATNALDTAITDASGQYQFPGLADGTYWVQVLTNSLPAGYQLTPSYDPTSPLDGWGWTNILNGNTVLTMDFGYPPVPGQTLYTVSGTVFYDANTNGTNNAEAGISNVTVNVAVDTDNDGTNDIFYAVTTATNGTYSVAGIPSNSTVTITVSQGTLPSVGYQATTTNALVVSHISADTPNQDFGFVEVLGSIGGTVVVGTNGNGLADVGEMALSNVTVTLRYAGGDGILNTEDDVLTTTNTDSGGNYTFGSLLPGVYQVVKATPSGYLDLADADGGNANNISVTLAMGQNAADRDFEVYRPAAIGDRVWLDENADGVQDAGEAGLANVTVSLLDTNNAVLATTVTDTRGGYRFPGLTPGTYTVRVETNTLAEGLAANTTFDPDATTNHQTTVTLTSGQENDTADFGYDWASRNEVVNNTGTGAIGDRVWIDANGNGLQDAGEPGMGGVSVALLSDSNGDGVLDTTNTTVTAADGSYVFDGLAAGPYVVLVNGGTEPTGYTATGDPDPAKDNRTTTPILLAPGDVYVNADFGYQPQANIGATIGDQVWFDANANGTLDGSERGIAGVTVALVRDANGNGAWDANEPIIATTVTATNGVYLFAGVPVADGTGTDDYLVWVNDVGSVLAGMTQTYDANGVGSASLSAVTDLAPAGNDLQDFGYTAPTQTAGAGLIGDTIFLDRNTNGVFDAGEGMEGVAVRLYGTNGVLLGSTVSDENGFYAFGGLGVSNATYEVQVDASTLPGTLTNTVYPAGGTENRSTVTLTEGAPLNRDQDFGYAPVSPPNVITGTLWEDLNANGSLAGGETGRFAGVTVALYDTNGNIVATTVTGTNGTYSFAGLPDGTYTVDVTDQGSLLNGYWHSLGTNGAAGNSQTDPYTTSVSGGSTVTVDFGYWLTGAALGNRVWCDINKDGLQTPEEPGMPVMAVNLRVVYANGVTNMVQTKSGVEGYYRFWYLLLDEGLPESGAGAPVYVLIPANTGALYPPTTVDVGGNVGTNDWIDSDNHAGVTGLASRGVWDMTVQTNPVTEPRAASYDFGYKFQPTLVRVTGFAAFTRDGGVIVRWETADERGTLGFWLERWENGNYKRVNSTLIPGKIFSLDGGIYEVPDGGAVSGGHYTYRLIEEEVGGTVRYLGPYSVTVDGDALSFNEWSRLLFDPGSLKDPAEMGLDGDPDHDGMNNLAEFIAGTEPTDAASALRVDAFDCGSVSVVVGWESRTGRVYRIERATSLDEGFVPLEGGIPATPPFNSYTDRVDGAGGGIFYRISVE